MPKSFEIMIQINFPNNSNLFNSLQCQAQWHHQLFRFLSLLHGKESTAEQFFTPKPTGERVSGSMEVEFEVRAAW
jgi:hypothetical protein